MSSERGEKTPKVYSPYAQNDGRLDVFYRVWYMSHSITHVLGDETMQMYGKFQGFCLQ